MKYKPTEGSAAHAEGAVNGRRYIFVIRKDPDFSIRRDPFITLCRPFCAFRGRARGAA